MTERDLRFADEYFVDYRAKHAAIRAGYSEKTARNAAAWIHPEHPEKPQLRALIDKKAAELSRRTGVTAERVIAELARVAFANITDAVDPDTGRLLKDVAAEDAAAVAGIRIKRGDEFSEYEVRMWDKIKALDLLGKHLGLYEDKITLEGGERPVVIIGGDLLED